LLWTSCRGQTLIEFALIAPVLFILLFGIIDFGMVLDHRITLQHAVREGARYAAVVSDCDAIQRRTADRAGNLISDPNTVAVTYDHNPAPAGDPVTVSAPFHYDFPLMSRFGVGAIDVGVSGSARLEMAVTDAGGCGP
jgi:hypothetical protein